MQLDVECAPLKKEAALKHFTKVAVVFLIVTSLVITQNNVLLAQSNLPNSPSTGNDAKNAPVDYAGLKNLIASVDKPTSAFAIPPRLSLLPPAGSSMPSAARAPQGSSTNWGLIAGLAMSGTGAILVARKEPVHQTTCIPYDACPVPGVVRMSGGLLLAVGVPLTIFKLKR